VIVMNLKIINILLKISLAGLLVHAVYFSDLPQYKDKAIALRVIFYPLTALLTYIVWRILQKRKGRNIEYPHIVDICLTSVVAFDLLGNTLALYDKITWWDDIMHLLLSIPWVLVVGYLIRNRGYSKWVTAGLVMAYGSTSHIVWELLEYLSFVRSNPTESLTAYQDTMGDLVLSLIGTIIGALITAFMLWQTKRNR
jgi:glycopeptide antibiotics resistance protein